MTYPQAAALSGQNLKEAFSAGSASLSGHRDSINALNVFPVPDGDTGTNMLLTMRAATDQASVEPGEAEVSVASISARLADGAFWGARGNSGVILSQFFAGMAHGLKEAETCTGTTLERSFRQGAQWAYNSVGNPIEGTMLTVLGALAPAVQELSAQGEENPIALWDAAFGAALKALDSTPSLLPVLKEAGVVDAGGLGVVVILGAALDQLTGGNRLDSLVADFESQTLTLQTMAAQPQSQEMGPGFDSHDYWGFCIQFVIQGRNLEPEAIRQHFGTGEASSTVVAGNENQVRVHLHAADPEPVLAYGRSLGQLQQVSVQDMDQQNHSFANRFVNSASSHSQLKAEIAVVAVASGDGLVNLFLDTGCAAVASGGQTMNPSVQQLLDSAGATGANEIIVLPNNTNVIAATRQAATQDPRLHVVAACSVPQGIAALLAFNPEQPLQNNLDAMEQALCSVTSVEVTRAVRSTSFGGIPVEEGQSVALTDGELVAAADSPESALKKALAQAGMGAGAFVTLYLGQHSNQQDAQDLANQLQAENDGIQVDLIYGGQPHYQYLASLE